MFRAACGLACLGIVVSGIAQEGHPLTGTWSGDWGPTTSQRNHLTFVMNWDGKNVTGTINPGPDSIPVGSVLLDVTNWTVRIEADAKDQSGRAVHIAAEGKLEDKHLAERLNSWLPANLRDTKKNETREEQGRDNRS